MTGLLLALMSLNPVAAKGGGSTFDFNRRWFAPGERAVGKTQFGTDVNTRTGQLPGEPYFAYLVRGDGFFEPPGLPPNAIRLARVRMKPVHGGIWEATVQFIVPDVRPGSYTISLCNLPCRSAYVGDLMGAWISIAATAEQAKMRNLEARITEDISQHSAEISDLYGQLEPLRQAVAADQSRSITVGTELRLTPIEDQVERLNAQVRALEKEADQGTVAWLWMAGWIVAAGLAIAWRATVVRRRGAAGGPRERRASELPLRTSSDASTGIPGASRTEPSGVGGDLSWHVELEQLEAATQE